MPNFFYGLIIIIAIFISSLLLSIVGKFAILYINCRKDRPIEAHIEKPNQNKAPAKVYFITTAKPKPRPKKPTRKKLDIAFKGLMVDAEHVQQIDESKGA